MRIPVVLVFVVLVAAAVPLAAQTELRVASIVYPPYLEEDGTTGMTYELLAGAFGPRYRLVIEVMPPARAQAEFEKGRFGLTLYSKDYSQVPGAIQARMYNARLVFLARAADAIPPWNKLGDLGGRTLGLTSSLQTSSGPIKTRLEEAGLTIVNLNTLEQGLSMLQANRVDLVFADAIAGWTIVRRQFPDGHPFVELSPPFLIRSGGPWFNTKVPGASQAAVDYRNGFRALVESGRAKAILEKYLGNVPEGILARETVP